MQPVKSVVIFGAGGFGREVLEIFKYQNKLSKEWDILGFIDENTEIQGKMVNDYPVLGGFDWLRKHTGHKYHCVCAVGTCETRKAVVQKLNEIDIDFVNAVHPSVIMSDYVQLGSDVIICAGSILTVNINIGDHTHINLNSTVGHDAVIGPYCTISPAVSINGHNRLGEGVFVGTGAVFNQDVSVGEWTTIGAGAVVTEDIPERVVAAGVPAKPIRKL
jgi:sugar O-acyltransferase (sialic acid O-acetyltransferase NeuD family)